MLGKTSFQNARVTPGNTILPRKRFGFEADSNNPSAAGGYENVTARNYKILDGRFFRGILVFSFLAQVQARIAIEFNIGNLSGEPTPYVVPWLIVVLLVCTDVFRGGKSKYYIPPDEQNDV